MDIPQECSWFWKKMLSLYFEVRSRISYRIGNGHNRLFYINPWRNNICIPYSPEEGILVNSCHMLMQKLAILFHPGSGLYLMHIITSLMPAYLLESNTSPFLLLILT